MRPKKNLQEIVDFLKDPKKFTRLGGTNSQRRALGGGARELAKPCWPGPLPEKQVCPFSASADLILWKCLWAWAQRGSAICLNRARKMRLALFSSMKLMPWAGTGAPVWAAAMMNGNRRSTSCWWKWMVLNPTKG